YDRIYYPAAVGSIIVGIFVAMAVIYPKGIDMFVTLIVRIYSFGILASPGALTVAEIQPGSVQGLFFAYGALFAVAFAGLLVMVYRVVMDNRPLELLVILWSLTMFSAYFTMARFGYYVAVNVAVLSGFFFWWVIFEILELDSTVKDIRDIKGYQVIAIVALVILVLPGNVVAIGGIGVPAWERAQQLGGTNDPWVNELDWVEGNTPEIPLEYDKIYEKPADGDFDYPVNSSPTEGAYGTMSWWDYGHWITFQAHRIPNANPFQQGEIASSDFFTSLSEKRANLILEALPSLKENQNINNMSTAELGDMVSNQTDQKRYEDTRYIMIDDQMAGGKFGPIATWTGFSGYVSRQQFQLNNQTVRLPSVNSKYDQTMLSRLYYDDAKGLEHYRLVHETETYALLGSVVNAQQGRIQRINRIVTRAQYDEPIIGDLTIQKADALPDAQTIQSTGGNYLYGLRSAASVKTFEHVEGAKLTGTVPSGNRTNVTAFLRLRMSNTERNFTYTQTVQSNENGKFNITVPYATEDDVSLAEGGTNSNVTALSNYGIYAGGVSVVDFRGSTTVLGQPNSSATVNVPESAVYEGEEISVDLQPFNPNATDTGTGTGTGTGTNETESG
ncbi:MAG: hypothetical protein SXQ77_09595, partial [Halobacteria archaeon]|nr:hypothetical protein [Halobacteria archaeon]